MSIIVAYDWPTRRPAVRTQVNVDSDVLARYVGTYQLTPDFSVTFTLEGNQLMTQATGQPKFPVYPEAPTKFFLKVVDAEVEFGTDDSGRVSYVILHQGGQDHKGIRKVTLEMSGWVTTSCGRYFRSSPNTSLNSGSFGKDDEAAG